VQKRSKGGRTIAGNFSRHPPGLMTQAQKSAASISHLEERCRKIGLLA
jgi:hypothetical protein